MSWEIAGRSMEMCSCKMLCPYWLGPEIEPDEGWCGATLAFDIQQGSSDGVDLSGTKVAFIADQGISNDAKAVLELIQREGADLVIHQGDFGYGMESDLSTLGSWHPGSRPRGGSPGSASYGRLYLEYLLLA